MIRTTILIAALAAAATGCKKKDDDGKPAEKSGESDKGGDKGGELPALTADPDPGAITAAEKPPFESVKFRMLAKRNGKGWPKYTAYNYGTKVVTAMAIHGYAYDASGKQVARTQTPMSWNGKLASGGKSDWDIEIGISGDPVPATAVSYEACFDAIKFEGDDKWTEENGRCPDQKPKSK